MKKEDLLAEVERYILVVLHELKESRQSDYEALRLLFPSEIPELAREWSKEDRDKIFSERSKISIWLVDQAEKQSELLVFIEGALSRRYHMETVPEVFFQDKSKQIDVRKHQRELFAERRIQNAIRREAGPSLAKMAGNFIGAMGAYAKDGFRNVNKEEHAVRQAICNGCEFWDRNARMGAGKCMKCGCSGAKLWMASSECPIKKWGKIPTGVPVEPQQA
jgi:hypothetical protein